MKYKNFTLDPFQVQAIEAIEKNHSVVVSAATGTGKTLIADYIIHKAIQEGKRVIYTAPIKALSNQKFRDFREEYGDRVGLLTGDVSINEGAQILVMTTEIYRNMLMTRDDILTDLSYVVFDEIHYINDFDRGTVWEESIIFSPPFIRFLCLSATIPNAEVFAKWIQSIQKHEVHVVRYGKRAVPLKHLFFDYQHGIVDAKKMGEVLELERIPHYDQVFRRRGKRAKKHKPKLPNHVELIKDIRADRLPCIFFTFSRRNTMNLAQELYQKCDFLTDKERKIVIQKFNEKITDEVRGMDSVQTVKQLLSRGIGVHHAGLLPHIKEGVEVLFNMGLIRVLYATETFAVGINMPAKTVCFHSLEKYDGRNFRLLNSKEYFQMAGRAGRRGLDTVGYSIIMADRMKLNMKKVVPLITEDKDPIVSQYKICFNTILNLKKHYQDEKLIEKVLKSNFGYYVQRMGKKQVRIMSTYKNRVRTLEKHKYLDGKYITEKGDFASYVYANEMILTELMFSGAFEELSCIDICSLIGAIIHEGKGRNLPRADNIGRILKVINKNRIMREGIRITYIRNMVPIYGLWCRGGDFEELLEMTGLMEGDLIRMFRQAIDVLKQLRKASQYRPEWIEKLGKCMDLLDRDVVQIQM